MERGLLLCCEGGMSRRTEAALEASPFGMIRYTHTPTDTPSRKTCGSVLRPPMITMASSTRRALTLFVNAVFPVKRVSRAEL
jgi:hypothetical protein